MLILLFILPIDVVYEIQVETRTYPSKEWKLVKDGSDFRTEEVNYTTGPFSNSKSFVFQRGDVIDIHFDEHLHDGAFVHKDSILLQFSSMMHNLRIQRALNEIEIQESLRNAGNAAMKAPILMEAKERISLAESNLKLQEVNHKRLANLVKDGIISQAELDAQTNRLEVARQKLYIAKQNLRSTTFEEKPEDVAVYETRISNTDKELDLLLAQQNSYTIPSPFSGQLEMNPAEEILLSIRDTGSISLLFPFPIDQKDILSESSFLALETENGQVSLPFHLKEDVSIIQGEQKCLGIARLDGEQLAFGHVMRASVVCDTLTLKNYLLRKLM